MNAAFAIDAGSSPEAGARTERLSMTDLEFRNFYAATARSLKSYVVRVTGRADLADDLLQESYYRMLRVELPELDAAQRKNYLFRIATNLMRDHFRQAHRESAPLDDATPGTSAATPVDLTEDVRRVLLQIQPKERELVWLAYVEGASHREIAAMTGLKEASIRPLLYRIRRKLAEILRRRGLTGGSQ